MRLFIALLLGFSVVSLMFYGIWVPWPDPMESELRTIMDRNAPTPSGPVADTIDRIAESLEGAPTKVWARSAYADEFDSILKTAHALSKRAFNDPDLASKHHIFRQVRALLELMESKVDDSEAPNNDWIVDPSFKHDLSVAIARARSSVDQGLLIDR